MSLDQRTTWVSGIALNSGIHLSSALKMWDYKKTLKTVSFLNELLDPSLFQ